MKKENPKTGFLIFAILGIGLLIGGIIWYNSMQTFMGSAVETRAIVVDEVRETDPSDHSKYRYLYTLEYTVNGEKYSTTEVAGESPTMDVGEAKKIYVNPDDPEDFQLGGTGTAVGMIIMGAVCVLIGIVGAMPRQKASAPQETQNPQP